MIYCRERRVIRSCNAGKPRRQFYYRIAVAHPDGIVFALLPDSFKQAALSQNLDFGAAELAFVSGCDLATQLRRHHLLAIADTKDWHASGKDDIRHARRAFLMNGG